MPEENPEHQPTDAEHPPEEAFALVGHEIRAEIIKILGEYPGEDELSFSEIRSRLDTDIDPSGLHYHLQQLVGQFVAKTANGYMLLSSGARVLPPLRSGGFTPQQETMSCEAGFDCDHCDTSVVVTFANGWVEIECPDCEYNYFEYPLIYIPLDTFEHAKAAFRQFRKYMALNDLFIARGVCPTCGHTLDTKFHADEDHPGAPKVCIYQSCTQCRIEWGLSVEETLRADPGLIGFCHEHGVDVLSTPRWELDSALSESNVVIHSTDPWEVALKVTFDDETLELAVDDGLTVIERNRRDGAKSGVPWLVAGVQSAAHLMGSMESGDEVVLPDNPTCVEYIRRHRWPDGVVCPHCTSPNTIKKGKTGKDAQRYRCQDCERIFNDLSGTLFADYGLSLPEMFYIIRELEAADVAELSQQLDRSNQTIRNFIHDIQDALANASDATTFAA